MINDEVLRKAATEANQVITESLPSSAACAHSFSPTFHKKCSERYGEAITP